MDNRQVSPAVLKRLPRYYRYLSELFINDVTRISSMELSRRMGVTASQIRQDLSNFGAFGQQGYGYNVENLLSEINRILGMEKNYNLIVIGAGNIGKALVNYAGFSKLGFYITAFFDIDKNIAGKKIRGIPVYGMDKLKEYIASNKIDIAVMAVTGANALEVAATLYSCGIKGIWNFTNFDLNEPEDVVVESVHLTDSLMTLALKLNMPG